MPKARTCPNCGAKSGENDRSCSSCGFPLANEAPKQASQTKEAKKTRRGPLHPAASRPGAPPTRPSKCPGCGNELASSSPYCPFCGLHLEAVSRPRQAAVFQEPELEEIEAIFEEPLEFAKGGEEGEVITKQELLDYLRTMEGLAHLLKGSQKYGELLKEAVIDATDSVFASAYGRERLDSDEEAVRYAIKAIERACQRRGIPLPPEWHE